MATENLQVARLLDVIPSDNALIPYPEVRTTRTNTSTASSKLIDSSGQFIAKNVATGDIVYNTTDSLAATISSVDSETQVTLNANIFTGTGKTYVIYNGTLNRRGCLIFTGGAGNIEVGTADGDRIVLYGAVAGQYHPVHVNQVYSGSTTATHIVALW